MTIARVSRPSAPLVPSTASRRLLFFGLITVVTVVAFEAVSVATIMPIAVGDLHGLGSYAWAFTAFLGASLIGSVVAGERIDEVGPGWPFLAGVGAFCAGLAVAGFATSMLVFIVGRGIQGLGGGAIIVGIYVIIGRAFDDSSRPRAFSALSSAWVLPSVLGPLLAGLVAEHIGWRWVFLGLLPLAPPAVLPLLPTLRRIGFARPAAAAAGEPAAIRPPRRTGAVLRVAVGVGLMLYAGETLRWSSLVPLAVGLALVVPSVARLFPPGTLRLRRGLPATVATRGMLGAAFFATEAFIPLSLIKHRGLSPTLAGLALTGAAIGWAAGSWFQGRPTLKVSRPALVRLGAVLVGVGVGGSALTLWPALTPNVAGVAWAVAGAGMGLAMASMSVLVFQHSPTAEQGTNSASLQLADTLASAVGVGAGGVVLAAVVAAGASLAWAVLAIDVAMLAVAALAATFASRLRMPVRT